MALISDQTLGSPAAAITFSAIPATYKHLRVILDVASSRASTNDTVTLRFNSDSTSAHYVGAYITGTGTVVSEVEGDQTTAISVAQCSGTSQANYSAGATILIPNYAGTTFNQNVIAETYGFTGAGRINIHGGTWGTQAAVTRIDLQLFTGPNFVTGSRATLYGVS